MYLFAALDSICAAQSRGVCEQHTAQAILHIITLTYIRTVDYRLYLENVFYVELCRLNLIIAKGTLNPLIREHPEVTFCSIQLVFILCAIWKQACCALLGYFASLVS